MGLFGCVAVNFSIFITRPFSMKKLLFTVIAFLALIVVQGQTANWEWAKNAGGSDNETGYGVASDKFGNIYATGLFTSPSITFGTKTLINNSTAGNYDIYIVKYDSSGNVLWAKSAGGSGYDAGYSICTDILDNIYITGVFNSPSIVFGTYTLTASGSDNVFIAKYSSSGNVLWAKTANGTGWQRSLGVSSDIYGNAYMTGYFDVANLSFGSYNLISGGSLNVFLAKYDSIGNVMWAKSAAINGNYGSGTSVCNDKKGNVYVTGYYNGAKIIFDTDTLTNTNNLNYADIFLVNYDSAGNIKWAKSAGGIDYDESYGVSADTSGNVFITGSFGAPNATFDTITLTNSGSTDIFIAKYNSSGNIIWAKSTGSVNSDVGQSVCNDLFGNVLFTGNIDATLIVKKYDTNGNSLFTKNTNATGAYSICADLSGNAYVTGDLLGNGQFDGINLINNGSNDMYIAKLNTKTIAAINQFSNNSTISVYPNPSSTNFVIETSNKDKQTLQVFDINGKLVLTQSINGKTNIDVSNLAEGVYNLSLQNANGVVNKRLVIVR